MRIVLLLRRGQFACGTAKRDGAGGDGGRCRTGDVPALRIGYAIRYRAHALEQRPRRGALYKVGGASA